MRRIVYNHPFWANLRTAVVMSTGDVCSCGRQGSKLYTNKPRSQWGKELSPKDFKMVCLQCYHSFTNSRRKKRYGEGNPSRSKTSHILVTSEMRIQLNNYMDFLSVNFGKSLKRNDGLTVMLQILKRIPDKQMKEIICSLEDRPGNRLH